MNIKFTHTFSFDDILIVGIYDEKIMTHAAKKIDKEVNGAIQFSLEENNFKGKIGEIYIILTPRKVGYTHLILLGLGKKKDLTPQKLEIIGGNLIANLSNISHKKVSIFVEGIKCKRLNLSQTSARVAQGILLRSFHFDKYFTQKKMKAPNSFHLILPSLKVVREARVVFYSLKSVADGVFYARSFVSEPPNILYPKSFAKELRKLSNLKIKVEILDKKEMKKLGMNAIVGVGQGSIHEPQLVLLEWNYNKIDKKPIVLVGKGVTFDTGGISLKRSGGMHEMKWDMAGAATIAGIIKTLALRRAKVNVVGVLALVENMPSGNAQRPGDVVKSLSGKTIEILDTDAEGRLVLADALWYGQDRYKPEIMIDLATLTGAIVVTFGAEYAGLFSNDNALAQKLYESGLEVGEKLWRLPLHSAYEKDIFSDIADVKNVAPSRGANSIIAAQFLANFVNNTPWAHLDITGLVWSSVDTPLYEKGATAFGVRLLEKFISKYYEES